MRPPPAVALPLIAKRDTAPSVMTYHFDASKANFKFEAGQWADFYLTDEGVHLVAGFSMASSPSSPAVLEFSVKRTDHPVTQYFHDTLSVGERVLLDGGHGDFCWNRVKSDALVLIGGGIGITPLLSILRLANTDHPEVPLTFIYSAATQRELLFHDEITLRQQRSANLRYVPIVTRDAAAQWAGRRTRLDAALLREVLPSGDRLNRTLFYLCGPAALIKDAKHMLLELGVEKDRLCYEKWQVSAMPT